MNLSGDGINDGKFIIKRGQGLSQGIAGELGLTEAECKQLGSVWAEILDMAAEQDAFHDDSLKYVGGQSLSVGDTFQFSERTWGQIVDTVDRKLHNNTNKIDESDSNNQKVVNSDTENQDVMENVEYTENQLPSVLLKNTGIITAAMIVKAIKDRTYRAELLPDINKLNPKQKQAFDKACKEYDQAVAQRSQLQKNMKSGKAQAKNAKAKKSIINKAEENLQKSKIDFDKATMKVNKEQSKLNNNANYKKIKEELSKTDKEIKKLENKKANNKSKKLSRRKEARLSELKQKRANLIAGKNKHEIKLNEAKKALQEANNNLKNAQFLEKAAQSKKAVAEAQTAVNNVYKGLRANPEYKQVNKELNEVNSQIKELEAAKKATPKKFTKEQQKTLNKLLGKRSELINKKAKISKPYTEAKLKLNAAKAEAETLNKLAANAETTNKTVQKSLKAGTKKYRLNLKKLPKADAQILKASFKRMSKATQYGKVALKGVGKVAKPVAVILTAADIYNAYEDGGYKKATRQAVKSSTAIAAAAGGTWAGSKIGAGIGATIGSIIPGAGTVAGAAVGGFIGGIVGGIAGWWAGEKAYDAVEQKVLPGVTPLDQQSTGTTDVTELNAEDVDIELTEEQYSQLLKEHPEYKNALEEI